MTLPHEKKTKPSAGRREGGQSRGGGPALASVSKSYNLRRVISGCFRLAGRSGPLYYRDKT